LAEALRHSQSAGDPSSWGVPALTRRRTLPSPSPSA